jgi:hypothetical protein
MKYTLNGEQLSRQHNFCFRYEEILEQLDYAPSRVLTVTWKKPDGRCGEITRGQDIVVTDGTHIYVADTGNA